MFSNKDYSEMTRDELASEEKKLKTWALIVGLLVGVLVGVAIWSATHKGGFLRTVGLMAVALWLGSQYTKKRKSLQEEIARRKAH